MRLLLGGLPDSGQEADLLEDLSRGQILGQVGASLVHVWIDGVGREVPGTAGEVDADVACDRADHDPPALIDPRAQPQAQVVAFVDGVPCRPAAAVQQGRPLMAS